MKVEKKRRMRRKEKKTKERKDLARANRSRGRYILGKPRAKLRWVKWPPFFGYNQGRQDGQLQVQGRCSWGLAGCSFQGRAAESDGRCALVGGQRFVSKIHLSGQDMSPQPFVFEDKGEGSTGQGLRGTRRERVERVERVKTDGRNSATAAPSPLSLLARGKSASMSMPTSPATGSQKCTGPSEPSTSPPRQDQPVRRFAGYWEDA